MHPALKNASAGVEVANALQQGDRFCVSVHSSEGTEATRSKLGVEAENQTCVCEARNRRRGWHTFRHTVGTLLADMGEHQLTIRDYLRHSNLSVTNKYLQATSKTKRLAQEKLVEAILPSGSLPACKSTMIQ